MKPLGRVHQDKNLNVFSRFDETCIRWYGERERKPVALSATLLKTFQPFLCRSNGTTLTWILLSTFQSNIFMSGLS